MAMPRLVVWIPAMLPPASPQDPPKRIDLSPGSAARQFIAEALALGIDVEVDSMVQNQIGGAR